MRAVPVRLHGGDLDRLMLQRVEPVLVAEEKLQRRKHRDHAERHAHHDTALGLVPARHQIARPDRQDDERGRQICGGEHVGQAIWEAWIEDDCEPVERVGDAVAYLMPGRRLHPAVGREDPECRDRGADRDNRGR